MAVLGQYGVERWNADGEEYPVPPDPPEITRWRRSCRVCWPRLGLDEARIEHKGRAIGVHTRKLDRPGRGVRAGWATRSGSSPRGYGLSVEPGKNVWEIRARGIDKGIALRNIVAETERGR